MSRLPHKSDEPLIIEPNIPGLRLSSLLEWWKIAVIVFTLGMSYAALRGGQEEQKHLISKQSEEIQDIKQSYVRSDIQQQRELLLIDKLLDLRTRLDRIERKLDSK